MTPADSKQDVIVMEIVINSTPERVFRALTEPKELMAWWGTEDSCLPVGWNSDLRVGGRWRGDWKYPDGRPCHVQGEFLEINPPWKLSYTWEPSSGEIEELPPTTVTITLEAKGQGRTHLKLVHRGFSGYPKSFRDHEQGWTQALNWLKAFAEKH